MQTKQKQGNLVHPKITPLTKQQYKKFHKIRKLNTEILGSHTLLSHNHKKYIQKQFTSPPCLLTTRTCPVYSYNQQGTYIYIYKLIGQPLIDLWRGHQGKQMKEWVNRCGGFEFAMIQLVRVCVGLWVDYGVQDVLAEGFRVGDGKLVYCYDMWMRNSYDIVMSSNMQIQNYFLSQTQLKWLQSCSATSTATPVLPFQQYLFKIGLLVISFCIPELKIRNYEYCQFQLNKANIQQKLKLFTIKTANKELQNLVIKFMHAEFSKLEEVLKIVQYGKGKTQARPESQSKKGWDKENSILCIQSNSKQGHTRKYSTATKNQSFFIQKHNDSNKKIRLRNRSTINESTLNQSIIDNPTPSHCSSSQPFTLRTVLTNLPTITVTNIKLSEYLGLSEYLTETLYEKSILTALESIRVKVDWKQKLYTNGSVYFGEIQEEKRVGKGAYLFDSEDLYVGDWCDNVMSGNGIYVFKSGELYDGGLKKGLRSGYGKFIYKDGRVYEGHWQQNIKIGFGTVTFPNNTKFLGFFSKNSQTYGLFTKIVNGQVTQFQGNLQSYNWQTNTFSPQLPESTSLKLKLRHTSSHFSNNSQNEQALKFRGENSKYYGQHTYDNKPNGYGVKDEQNQIYQGWWRNGNQDGEGKIIVKGKFQVYGVWKQGFMVEYKKM